VLVPHRPLVPADPARPSLVVVEGTAGVKAVLGDVVSRALRRGLEHGRNLHDGPTREAQRQLLTIACTARQSYLLGVARGVPGDAAAAHAEGARPRRVSDERLDVGLGQQLLGLGHPCWHVAPGGECLILAPGAVDVQALVRSAQVVSCAPTTAQPQAVIGSNHLGEALGFLVSIASTKSVLRGPTAR
jgi:hypothetical protein